VRDIWELDAPVPTVELDIPVDDPLAPLAIYEEVQSHAVKPSRSTVGAILAGFAHLTMAVIPLSTSLFDACCLGGGTLVRSVRLGMKLEAWELVPHTPRVSTVQSWRREANVRRRRNAAPVDRAAPKSYEDILLELPAEWDRPGADERPAKRRRGPGAVDVDPVHLMNALCFSRFLRSVRDFTPAMQAAHVFDNPDEEEEDRDCSKDPSRSTIEDANRKLDVVDLLILRRRFHAAAAHDLLKAVNVYSDSSPVSRTEMQGMVIDVHFHNGDFERIELPGGTLCYGLFDAISKTICLLHAFWLIAGPDAATLQYFCSRVISVTTDFGTEKHTIEMRDCVRAYCEYMDGRPLDECRQFVDVTRRWLPNAIRLAGWSHSLGNTMKHTAEASARWPVMLDHMRVVVNFLRNSSWRTWIKRALSLNPPENVDLKVLDKFEAQSLAKWRYETVVATMGILCRYRALCEHHIHPEWFQNAQDKEELKKVFQACADKFFWKFMEVGHREVFWPTEYIRHWGMCCSHADCLQKRRDGAKHVKCDGNGRRLHEAWEFLKTEANKLKTRSQQITAAECENDEPLRDLISFFFF